MNEWNISRRLNCLYVDTELIVRQIAWIECTYSFERSRRILIIYNSQSVSHDSSTLYTRAYLRKKITVVIDRANDHDKMRHDLFWSNLHLFIENWSNWIEISFFDERMSNCDCVWKSTTFKSSSCISYLVMKCSATIRTWR